MTAFHEAMMTFGSGAPIVHGIALREEPSMLTDRLEVTMASEKQLRANRENAKRSNGPKSVTGKTLSRMNACKHGLTAELIVIGDEDPRAFDSAPRPTRSRPQPPTRDRKGTGRAHGSDHVAHSRVPVFEAALIEIQRNTEYASSSEPVIAFQNSRDTLGTLFRYETALMNAFNRTLQQLLCLQDRRAREESQVLDIVPNDHKQNAAAQ